jgi:hypothetical protein
MLPLWVQILQALAVPVIAAVGAWVALQQMHIARVKLQHGLYDRRYAVFQSVRSLLNEVNINKIVSPETFQSFVIGTTDAPFLFDDGLAEYLKEISHHARSLQSLQSINLVMESMPAGDQKTAALRKAGDHLQWLLQKIDVLAAKFQPFLQLDKRRRAPLRFF